MATTRYQVIVGSHEDSSDTLKEVFNETYDTVTEAIVVAKELARDRHHSGCHDCAFRYAQLCTALDGLANYPNTTLQSELDGDEYIVRPAKESANADE